MKSFLLKPRSIFVLFCLLLVPACSYTLTGGRAVQKSQPARDDRYQVAEAALRYLMDSHSGHGHGEGDCSAYVVDGGEFTPQLLTAFADYQPPVVANVQLSQNAVGAVIDKATGKRVKAWSVKVEGINGVYATAGVTWHSGNLAAGGHTLRLHRKNGHWIVVSEKMDWIS
jgi:hypothetical protein